MTRLKAFLLERQELTKDGLGPALPIHGAAGLLEITLGVMQVVEQESLLVAIQGSKDGEQWEAKPLLSFPQKFYPGVSKLLYDPAKHPEVQFLRAKWTLHRWGRGSLAPWFDLWVGVEEL